MNCPKCNRRIYLVGDDVYSCDVCALLFPSKAVVKPIPAEQATEPPMKGESEILIEIKRKLNEEYTKYWQKNNRSERETGIMQGLVEAWEIIAVAQGR